MTPSAAIVDIDGTLVDTNYQHAIGWQRAFRAAGLTVPAWTIHRHVGMGGDKLVAAIAGEDAERELGEQIREAETDEYRALIEEIEPLEGARELLVALKDRGVKVVLASSAKDWEVEHYIGLLDAKRIADGWTSSADVEATKPDSDLVEAALAKAGTREAVMIGDTVWDVKAAARAGIETVAVETGGFGRAELLDAGALTVYESVVELARDLDALPLK